MPGKRVPTRLHTLPSLNHTKDQVYVDYPVVSNSTVTTEPFYLEYNATVCTSSAANTTFYKWNGTGWTEITGLSNPDIIFGRGFYAVTTATDCYVTITEHVDEHPQTA